MGLVPVEKTFPRGGQAAAPRDPSKERRRPVKTPNLFGGKKAPTKPQKEVLLNKDGTKKKVEPFLRLRQYNGRLTHKTVSEGMLVLGSISRIQKFQLTVTLPGNIKGTVPVTNISEPYSTALHSVEDSEPYQLSDMFSIGQHVVTRVVSKVSEINSTLFKITLSMMPECIYSDLSHSDVVNSSVLTAAVKSIEEKGYIMDLGIKNTTAFLKRCNAADFENEWNNGRPLGIGQLVRCFVKKATAAESSTIVILSAKPKLVAGATSNNTGATLETLVPGMQFNATVSVLFRDGIQVRLSDNFVGYVQQDHFSKPFKTPDNFELGTMVTVKVLYILDSGAVYFTMKSGIFESQPRCLPFDVVSIGKVIEKAVVISINNGGYTVRVGKTETDPLKGFIPLSQTTLKRNAGDEEFDVPMSQQLAKEHPIGSEIKCRVTDYNYMDDIYLCTMDKSLMTEKYIHTSMLKPGLVLQCFIKSIQPKGIVVLLGKTTRMTAFVPLIHSSDVPLAHPEKKFNVGQPVTAKVLSLKDGNILFTLKPTLVRSREPMLTSYEEAEKDVRYEGTVLSITGKGLLVEFYNSTTGWVPPISLHKIAAANVDKNFYVGQVVQCTVIKKIDETQKLVLNIKDGPLPNEKKKEKKMQKQLAALVERAKEKPPSKSKSKEKEKVESAEEKKPKKKKIKKMVTATKEAENNVATVFDVRKTVGLSNSKSEEKGKVDSAEEKEPKLRKIKEKAAATKKAEENVATVFDVRKTVGLSVSSNRRERRKFLQTLRREAEKGSEPDAGNTVETQKTNNLELNGFKPKAGTLRKIKEKVTATKMAEENVATVFDVRKTVGLSVSSIRRERRKFLQTLRTEAEKGSEPDAGNTVETPKTNNLVLNGFKPKAGTSKSGTKRTSAAMSAVDAESDSDSAADRPGKKATWVKAKAEPMEMESDSDSAADRPGKKATGVKGRSEPVATKATWVKAKAEPIEMESDSDSADDRPGKKATGVKGRSEPVETKLTWVKVKAEPMEMEALPCLSVSTGFLWDPTPDLLPALARAKIESESSDEEEEPAGKKAKKTRQAIISEKRALAQAEEARLRAIEQRLMDTEQPPQSADEFDRLVLSSPDNSMVWLQYMAHHLQATEIEKARGVAQRALKAICFREEQERLNVWVALLNLENLYGTKESLELTLEEAAKVNDAYQVYTQMLQIYGDSQKLQEGDKLIVLMTKRYKGHKDMWFDAATFYMKSGQMEKARALLQRALASLEKKEHVSVISRFAQLENRLGSAERAQTLMEQILSSYPRRVDVWSAYVDMLVKSGLHHLARQVLERAVVQKLPSNKMKTLFTKFLSFEEAHGSEDGANKVRQMALEYVESAAGAAIQ